MPDVSNEAAFQPDLSYQDHHTAKAWHRFCKDTADHELTIVRDDDLYRHLRIQKPGAWCYGHDIVTWPGYLAITGDMGSYLFSRISDMFEFFASGGGDISPDYWAEKLQAPRGRSAVREFDLGAAEKWVAEWMTEQIEEHELNQPGDFRAEVQNQVLDKIDEGEHEFRAAVRDFRYGPASFYQDDHWDMSWDRYESQFLWCCWAIASAVRSYRLEAASVSA